MTDPISISPAQMAAACREDARRVVAIAAPLLTAGLLIEALSHASAPQSRMFLQPLLSAILCGGITLLTRQRCYRFSYPELVLLALLGLAMAVIASHMPSLSEPTRASTLVMLAVASVASATLIMPTLAAVLAIGTTTTVYVYAQAVHTETLVSPDLVAPVLVVMISVIVHRSRRSALRSVEELRERVARDQRELERANEQLRNLSITDPLTGALNRRGFDDRLAEELSAAARREEFLSVMLLDVDLFKNYNDDFGHPAGDVALRRSAQALQDCCRAGDSVARYGGEEFALILPFTDTSGCEHMADRVRRAIATLDGLARPITVSAGAATVHLDGETDLALVAGELLAAADGALYRAKQGGRDRAEFATLSPVAIREAIARPVAETAS